VKDTHSIHYFPSKRLVFGELGYPCRLPTSKYH
jgi:hypothetical protein